MEGDDLWQLFRSHSAQVLEPLQDCEVDCDTVHEAVAREHAARVRQLLARDDRIQAVTILLYSIHITTTGINACSEQDLPVCHGCLRALLAAGADPSISILSYCYEPAIRVKDVLQDARTRRRSADFRLDEWMITAKALQAAGLKFSFQDELHIAAGERARYGQSFDSFAMKILLECGVDPMRRDWYGQTALHTAAIGLDPELYDDDEQQQQQQIAVIQLLYEYGGDELLQATTSHEQETALHLA
eukprot:11880-Heterococcus_DN1.PRE.1